MGQIHSWRLGWFRNSSLAASDMGRRRAYVPGGFATAARLCRALTELPTGVGISDAVSFCFRKPANIARGAAPAPAVNERELR